MSKVDLPRDIEAWAKAEVAAGRAASVEAFVARALREQRALFSGHNDLVEDAYKSLDAGDVRDETSVDAELDRWIAEDLAATR